LAQFCGVHDTLFGIHIPQFGSSAQQHSWHCGSASQQGHSWSDLIHLPRHGQYTGLQVPIIISHAVQRSQPTVRSVHPVILLLPSNVNLTHEPQHSVVMFPSVQGIPVPQLLDEFKHGNHLVLGPPHSSVGQIQVEPQVLEPHPVPRLPQVAIQPSWH